MTAARSDQTIYLSRRLDPAWEEAGYTYLALLTARDELNRENLRIMQESGQGRRGCSFAVK